MINEFDLTACSNMSINCVENPFNMGIFYKLTVSFSMGPLSEP